MEMVEFTNMALPAWVLGEELRIAGLKNCPCDETDTRA